MSGGAVHVEFRTGLAEPVVAACRWLGDAYRRGERVLVTAPPARLDAIARGLWTLHERDFVAHARLPAAAAVVARSPIWLAPSVDDAAAPPGTAPPRLLLNVGADAPPRAGGFDRIVEMVAADPVETDAGRRRWRAYQALGCAPVLAARDG